MTTICTRDSIRPIRLTVALGLKRRKTPKFHKRETRELSMVWHITLASSFVIFHTASTEVTGLLAHTGLFLQQIKRKLSQAPRKLNKIRISLHWQITGFILLLFLYQNFFIGQSKVTLEMFCFPGLVSVSCDPKLFFQFDSWFYWVAFSFCSFLFVCLLWDRHTFSSGVLRKNTVHILEETCATSTKHKDINSWIQV